jgi:hypothetical protein
MRTLFGRKRADGSLEPLSAARNPKLREARQMAFWGSLLAIMGGFCTYFLFVDPFLKSREAKSWPAVPCEILESRARKSRSSRRTEYEPDVTFQYEFGGRTHRSNQSHFESAEPEELAETTRFLAKYPAGSKAVCYVNPKDVKEAVLDRSFPITSFYPLIGLCMLGGGLAGAVWGFRTIFGAKRAALTPVKEAASRWGASPNPGPVNLSPLTASTALLMASMAGMLATGGIIAWRGLRFWHNWRELGIIQFSLIEVLILVFTAAGFGYLALRCWRYFDPHPNLKLERGSVELGDAFELDWRFTGPVERLRSLRIILQGREETTVAEQVRGQYGIKQASEKQEHDAFYQDSLLTTQSQSEAVRGRVCVKLPRGTMPTFTGEKTKIVWSLRFEGDIAWSLPMKHDFPINVLPETAHA